MKKILIVDDFIGNTELLEDILSECYETDTANDGREAIEKIGQGNDYSMILLDLMMPNVDGFGVLEYMKEHNLLEICPVIIISGDSNTETESRCFDYGVADFIAKPFKEKIILKRVANILSLKEAIKKAEQANESKTKFLYNMSHDIRTPMNAIVGYSELLEKNSASDEITRDYLGKIKASSDFLLSLINSVLELSRIESGHVALEDEIVDAEGVFGSLHDVFCERMKQKDIDYVYETKLTSRYLYMDKLKVNEIVLNLLSNAYKYTEEGGRVSFCIDEKLCEKEGYTVIQITVSDTGIGMSEEYLPILFHEFTREKTKEVHKIEGTGLGMPIVKKMIDLMEGSIEVYSKLGEGTSFTVTFELKIGEEPEANDISQNKYDYSKLVGKRILLTEDNEINAELATIILEDIGFLVELAEDGAICLEMLRQSEDNYYDLILMDVQMPNMNGYEATTEIRKMENPYHSSIPIIAMTADAFVENINACQEAGMDRHIAKPINTNVLLETVSSVMMEKNR